MPGLRPSQSAGQQELTRGLLDRPVEPDQDEPVTRPGLALEPVSEPQAEAVSFRRSIGGALADDSPVEASLTETMRLTVMDDDAPDADDEKIDIFSGVECCSGFAFYFALMTLCVVDLLHVALTILFCGTVWKQTGQTATGTDALPLADQWLGTASVACIALYGIKIVSQVGILIQRWWTIRRRLRAQNEQWSLTECWREDQEWFVSMTFNSFLMMFIMLMVEKPYQMQKRASLSFTLKVDAKDTERHKRHPRREPREGADKVADKHKIPRGAIVTVRAAVKRGRVPRREPDAEARQWVQVRHWQLEEGAKKERIERIDGGWIQESWLGVHWKRRELGILGVFARIGKGGTKDLFASWVMLTNIACTSLAMVITAQYLLLGRAGGVMAWLSLGTVILHFVVASGLYIFTKLIRTQGGSITRAAGAILIGVVDIVNVIVALLLVAHLAYLNCDGRDHLSIKVQTELGYNPENPFGSINPSTGLQFQPHSSGPLHCTDHSIERDGCAKTMCSAMCWTDSSLTAIPSGATEDVICQSQFCNCKKTFRQQQCDPHDDSCLLSSVNGRSGYTHFFSCATDLSSGEKHFADQLAWNAIVFAWVMALLVGMATQWILALLQGLTLASLGLRRAKMERKNMSLDGRDREFDEATNLFQVSTFNTWIMALALIFLEKPYSHHLFEAGSNSPFVQRYSVGKKAAFQIACSIVACCKLYSVIMLFYVSMAYYRFVEPWEQQGRVHAPPGWKKQYVSGWATLTHPLSACRMGRITTNSSSSQEIEDETHDLWDNSDERDNEVTLVFASVAVFLMQMAISFWCMFVRNQKTRSEKFAAFGMLIFCVVDACAICCTGYFAHCVRVRSDPLLQCEEDFGSYLLMQLHPDEGTQVYIWMATAVLCLYAARFVLQLFIMARRRVLAMQNPDHDQRLRDEDLAPAAGLLANGAVHGAFILLAMFPMDLGPLMAGRWSPMARRPHWSNGVIQTVVLLEKTILGYLMIYAVDVDHDDQGSDGAQIVRLPLVTLFVLQTTIQVGFFLIYHTVRPGRPYVPEVGDRVRVVGPGDFEPGCCKIILTCGRAQQRAVSQTEWEAATDSLDVAMSLQLAADSPRTTHATDCRASIDAPVQLETYWTGKVVSVAAEGHYNVLRDGDGSGETIACEPAGAGFGFVPIQRIASFKWSVAAVLLAFLDWFHIAFNLMNLHIIRTTVPTDSNGLPDGFCFFQVKSGTYHKATAFSYIPSPGEERLHQDGELWSAHDDDGIKYNRSSLCAAIDARHVREGTWQQCNQEIEVCCWICISIYVLRMVVQPLIVFFGARSFDATNVGNELANAEKRMKSKEKQMRNSRMTYGENDPRYEDAQDEYRRAREAYDKAVEDQTRLAVESAAEPEVAPAKSYEDQLRDIFQAHDPERLKEIDEYLRDWKGSEQDLMDNIRKKYGILADPEPEPEPGSSASSEQVVVDATHLWEQQEKWMTTMTFNTFLMLPAMMFVQNPYKDNGESVRTAYVRLGSDGPKDWYAGMVLLLMVIKKSLNVYLIVRALTEAGFSEDSDTQYISMCLLAAHFMVAMYIMLLPKLANSQQGSYWKGFALLTIALADWFAVPIGLISLIRHGLEKHSDHCDQFLVKQISYLGLVLFGVRILMQIFVYLRFKYSSSGWDYISRPTHQTEEEEAEWKNEEEHRWKKWRDEFQQLTFNTWMMIPALLFIEKPYYDNLLARGKTSPFRQKSVSISLIYIVMVLKACCILYVNTVLIEAEQCQSSTTTSNHACLNVTHVQDSTTDGVISSTNAVGDEFPKLIPKLAVLTTCAHSLVFLYSMMWNHIGGSTVSSRANDDETDSDTDDENYPETASIETPPAGGGTTPEAADAGAITGGMPEDESRRLLRYRTREQMERLVRDEAVAPGTRIRASIYPEGSYVSCINRIGRRKVHVLDCGDEVGRVELEFDPKTTRFREENGVIVCEDIVA